MKYPAVAALLAALICGAAPSWADDVAATPVSQSGGDYPDAAGGQEGLVYVGFDIDATGHTSDVHVLGATEPGVFDQAAIATVQGWSYQPRMVNGQATRQTGNEIRLRFVPPRDEVLPPVQIANMPPLYTEALYRAGQEGDVTLSYSVSAMGDVYNIRVVQATKPGVFDQMAVYELSAQCFLPATMNGIPQSTDGLNVTYRFRLADAVILPRVKHPPEVSLESNGSMKGVPVFTYVAVGIDPSGRVTAVKPLTATNNTRYVDAVVAGFKILSFDRCPLILLPAKPE